MSGHVDGMGERLKFSLESQEIDGPFIYDPFIDIITFKCILKELL
jgi:hypothetical protein